MAALSISHRAFSPTKTQSTQYISNRRCRKVLFVLRCHSKEDPSDPSEPEKNKEEKQQLKRNFLLGFEKIGKGLKENLSPQRKGDWKDVTLMCLSFAVYVYISQKIVCAYCVWVSFPKQHW